MFSLRTSPSLPLTTVCAVDLIDQALCVSGRLPRAPRERNNFLS